jgi:CO/xanthine dehydrogenase FAD-binding subunit
MKPPPLRYERADTADGAAAFLAAGGGDAKVLAGGQSLVALLNLRLARPETVLDIGRLDELRHHGATNGHLEVGAMTTQRTLERDTSALASCPLLRAAIPYVGHPAIRNRTVGGTIAHADPAAELPVATLGIKGVGESGTVFAPAAIATGVADALGTEVDRLELNPSKVYALTQEAALVAGGS